MKGLIRGIMAGSAAAAAGIVVLSQLSPPPGPANGQDAHAALRTAPAQDQPAAAPQVTTEIPRPPAGTNRAPALPTAADSASAPDQPSAPPPRVPPPPSADPAPAVAAVHAVTPKLAQALLPTPVREATTTAPVDPRPLSTAASGPALTATPPAAPQQAIAVRPVPAGPALAPPALQPPPLRPASAPAIPAPPALAALPVAPAVASPARAANPPPPAAPHQALASRAAPGAPAGPVPAPVALSAPAVPLPPEAPLLAWLPHLPQALLPPGPASDGTTPADSATFASDPPLITQVQADPAPPPAPGTSVRRGTGSTPQAPAEPPPATVTSDPDAPPLLREAGAFVAAPDRPPFAIILIDTAAPDVDRAAIAALPFPVTIAIDPLSQGAAARATAYRAAGKEVLMLLTALPAGATAADVEQNLAVMAETLPQATAAIDGPAATLQNDLQAAGQLVPILAAQGRGLVTWDVGLDAAAQVARREALPHATIFRHLDGKGENRQTIRRYLDRAAFRAVQEGEVAVAGETRPETIAALVEWAAEGRAATVSLAPASALMTN